jgi:hypothetical protein
LFSCRHLSVFIVEAGGHQSIETQSHAGGGRVHSVVFPTYRHLSFSIPRYFCYGYLSEFFSWPYNNITDTFPVPIPFLSWVHCGHFSGSFPSSTTRHLSRSIPGSSILTLFRIYSELSTNTFPIPFLTRRHRTATCALPYSPCKP